MSWRRILLAATVGAVMAPTLHAAQLQLSTGVEYTRGDYGELTATEAFIVPFSARVSFGSLSLRASVPWLSVRGPADIAPVVDDDGVERGSDRGHGRHGNGPNGSGAGVGGGAEADDFTADRTAQGLGDVTLSTAWSFRDIGGTWLYVDVTGRMRLPSGDRARGLGRGTTDYATLAEFGWNGDRGGVFVMGGRQYLESTATVRRRDTWQGSAGGWVNVGRKSLVGAQGNWRQASTAAGVDSRSVDVFVNVGLAAGWRVDVSGGAGLSKASADYAVGLGITWRSARR